MGQQMMSCLLILLVLLGVVAKVKNQHGDDKYSKIWNNFARFESN